MVVGRKIGFFFQLRELQAFEIDMSSILKCVGKKAPFLDQGGSKQPSTTCKNSEVWEKLQFRVIASFRQPTFAKIDHSQPLAPSLEILETPQMPKTPENGRFRPPDQFHHVFRAIWTPKHMKYMGRRPCQPFFLTF